MNGKRTVAVLVAAALSASAAIGRAETTTISYPPASAETQSAKFIVRCPPSHRKAVDPIVAPGAGSRSSHLHEFFGNRSTDSDSTYDSMTAAGTTCATSHDTAGYWAPALMRPGGRRVRPATAFAYYRNRPVRYGQTVPFPANLRMIAGGPGAFPDVAFWNCFRDDSDRVRYKSPPRCTGDHLVAHVFFPNCWDGVRVDSRDHRSHVVHPTGSGRTACPRSHPVKLPQLRFFVRYPEGAGGRGWRLSDGSTIPHADFWNTWRQPEIEQLVRRCLAAGVECGRVED